MSVVIFGNLNLDLSVDKSSGIRGNFNFVRREQIVSRCIRAASAWGLCLRGKTREEKEEERQAERQKHFIQN